MGEQSQETLSKKFNKAERQECRTLLKRKIAVLSWKYSELIKNITTLNYEESLKLSPSPIKV